MKLYDVIRKEDIERGTPLKETFVDSHNNTPEKKYTVPRNRFVWKKVIIIFIIALFFSVLYIIGMNVVRAKVVIDERRIPFSLDGTDFELTYEGGTDSGRLSFQTMAVSTEVSREVYGSQTEPSTSIAKGKVVFFNEYSTQPQIIKAKTIIVGTNKKKYQTTQSATVLGFTMKNKIKTAGTSVSIPVVAVDVGPTYNTPDTTFTINDYSGLRAKQLYAQSVGAITGGEDKIAHSVSQTDRGDVVATLQSQLIERLKRETRAQIPDNFLAFPELQVTTIDNNSLILKGDSIKFPASIKGTMVTYLIPRGLLEMAIANHIRSDRAYPRVSIPTIGNLQVVPINSLPADPKNIPDSIKIKITGNGTIITKASLETIKESLRGVSKYNFTTVLATVPEIDTAQYYLYPFWAPFFPTVLSRITVVVQ